jgi:hypothetical protein
LSASPQFGNRPPFDKVKRIKDRLNSTSNE